MTEIRKPAFAVIEIVRPIEEAWLLSEAAKAFSGSVEFPVVNSESSTPKSFTTSEGLNFLVPPKRAAYVITLPGLAAGQGNKFWQKVQELELAQKQSV